MRNKFGRPALESVTPYQVPGSSTADDGVQLSKMDANELPFLKEISVFSGTYGCQINAGRYPDADSISLVRAISNHFSVDACNVIVGNGSDDLLRNIALAYFGSTVAIPQFTYPVYSHFAALCELKVIRLEMDDRFDITNACIAKFSREMPSLAFFSYPNNPTGNCFNAEVLQHLISGNPNTLFVIDEAYYEFSEKTLLPFAQTCPNVVIVRTFSKAFGLAGIRLGYAVANEAVIEMLKKTQLPYPVNSLTQAVAVATIGAGPEQIEITRKRVITLRNQLEEGLNKISWIVTYPSEANFVFFKVKKDIEASVLCGLMASEGVLIRTFDYGSRGLFVRMSIGTEDENARALYMLNNVLKSTASV